MAGRRSQGTAASRKHSAQPRETTKDTCARSWWRWPAARGERGQGLGHTGRGEPDLQEGEVAEEEVHGRLQGPVRPDQGDGGQVADHREHVYDQEEEEEPHVQALRPGKPSRMNSPCVERFWLPPQAVRLCWDTDHCRPVRGTSHPKCPLEAQEQRGRPWPPSLGSTHLVSIPGLQPGLESLWEPASRPWTLPSSGSRSEGDWTQVISCLPPGEGGTSPHSRLFAMGGHFLILDSLSPGGCLLWTLCHGGARPHSRFLVT